MKLYSGYLFGPACKTIKFSYFDQLVPENGFNKANFEINISTMCQIVRFLRVRVGDSARLVNNGFSKRVVLSSCRQNNLNFRLIVMHHKMRFYLDFIEPSNNSNAHVWNILRIENTHNKSSDEDIFKNVVRSVIIPVRVAAMPLEL